MTLGGWIGLGLVTLIAAVAATEAWVKRGKRRPLSETHQDKPEKERQARERQLGMEATDLNLVDGVERENERIERRNWNRIKRHRP